MYLLIKVLLIRTKKKNAFETLRFQLIHCHSIEKIIQP